jgi:hypothetical protein
MSQYDTIIRFIPTKDSKDVDWIQWHKMLVKGLGRDRANQTFTVAFAYLASSSAKTNDLRNYGNTVGLDLDTNLVQDAARIVTTVQESIGGVFDKIGGIFRTSKYIVLIVVALILMPVFMLLFNVAKKPGEVVGTAARAYSGGGAGLIK